MQLVDTGGASFLQVQDESLRQFVSDPAPIYPSQVLPCINSDKRHYCENWLWNRNQKLYSKLSLCEVQFLWNLWLYLSSLKKLVCDDFVQVLNLSFVSFWSIFVQASNKSCPPLTPITLQLSTKFVSFQWNFQMYHKVIVCISCRLESWTETLLLWCVIKCLDCHLRKRPVFLRFCPYFCDLVQVNIGLNMH